MTDMYAINPDYAARLLRDALELHGPMQHAQPVAAAHLLALTGKLPDLLLALWANHGAGDLMDGRLKFCAPHRFDSVMSYLFGAEEDMAGACHVFATTAFGDLFAWHERHWLIRVSPVRGWVLAPHLLHPETLDDANKLFYETILMADPAGFDLYDTEEMPLFDRAKAKFGPLRPGLIWGMLPIPPPPEEVMLENLRLVVPEDYLGEVISQLTLMLQDFEGDRFNLRGFGGMQ
jgi:hypothetical protein